MKIAINVFIVLTAALLGFLFGHSYDFTNMAPCNNLKEAEISEIEDNKISASLMIDYQDGKIQIFDFNDLSEDTSVFDLLKKAEIERGILLDYKDFGGDMGIMINKIDSMPSGVELDKYWQYWINNKYAQIGAKFQKINNNDVIEWKLVKGQF